MRHWSRRHVFFGVGLLLAAGCGGGAGDEVANSALSITIAPLPEPFEVLDNEGETLRLAVDGEAARGLVELHLGAPQPQGINLVDEATGRRAYFESLPGGEFLGNQEIVAPIGSVYTARGRYDGDSGPVEELWSMTVPPGDDRLLTLVYRYPAGDDSQQRAQQLLELLGNLAATGKS